MKTHATWTLLLVGILNVGPLHAARAAGEEPMKTVSERLQDALQEFDKSPDATRLRPYVEEVSAVVAVGEPQSAVRSFKLRSLVQILASLERKIDPQFDPNDAPSRNVAPPGHQYPSGVAPGSIKDEKVRKEYEAVLAANKAKAATFNLQTELTRMRESVLDKLEALAADRTTEPAQAMNELTRLLDEWSIAGTSRSRILSAAGRAR